MGGTLAQQLGFGADERVAIVHCDDIGMCHAANQGAFEALRRGPATCGSLMVPCPGFAEAAELARASPGLDLGVHLTLNAEWPRYRWGPVAGARGGALAGRRRGVPAAHHPRDPRARQARAGGDRAARADRARAGGRDRRDPPGCPHGNGAVAAASAPSTRRSPATTACRSSPCAPIPPRCARPGVAGAENLFAALVAALEDAGVPILDGFDANSLGFTPGEGEAHNRSRLRGLRAGHQLSDLPSRAGRPGALGDLPRRPRPRLRARLLRRRGGRARARGRGDPHARHARAARPHARR